MSEIFQKAIVEKRNVLNELRSNNMTLQELRFFSIYLSKIDPYRVDTRRVSFPIDDFQKIMGFGRLNISQLKENVDSLLTKIVHVPNERGGFSAFQLFKECIVDKNENNEWYVLIDAHDKALPLMFEFKNRYFTYELWNALRLKSANQIRMYEILKQYEKIGRREISIKELRELLGITSKKYDRWDNFRRKVLDSCQEALEEYTDICYTYERGKTGAGGKWLTVIFNIHKNKDYVDPLTLDKFIDMQSLPEPAEIDTNDYIEGQMTILDDSDEPIEIEYGSELANLLGDAALNNEFDPKQVRVIQDLVMKALPGSSHVEMCSYLLKQVHKMEVYSPKKSKRFSYLCKMIETDIEED